MTFILVLNFKNIYIISRIDFKLNNDLNKTKKI